MTSLIYQLNNMSWQIFQRAIQNATRNYLRNFWLTLATVFMLVLALLVMNAIITLHFLSSEAINYLQGHVAVSVYLKPETAPDDVGNLKAALKNLPYVTDVTLLSKDEALQRFKSLHQNNPVLLQSLQELDYNPLGDSLEIKTGTIADYTPLLAFIQQPQYQKNIADKDFRNYQELVGRLQNFADHFRSGGLTVFGFFLLISILVIFNTVRITMYARREEIGIMKLVGATNFFIRLPFLLETVLQTLTAMIIQLTILAIGFHFFKPFWLELFGGQVADPALYFWSHGFLFIGGELVMILVLTTLSGFWATHRYLKT